MPHDACDACDAFGAQSYDLGLRLKISEPSGVKGERGPVLRVLGFVRAAHSAGQQAHASHAKHAAAAAAASSSTGGTPHAWEGDRDSVRIIGSRAHRPLTANAGQSSGGGAGGKGGGAGPAFGGWELSTRCVQLLQAYTLAFPALFAALNASSPTERFFAADKLFAYARAPGFNGGGGVGGELARVVGWLGSLEAMRLPRAPLSTEALGADAVRAIQKAADTRLAKLGSQPALTFEVLDALPVAQVCSGASALQPSTR